MRSLSDKRKRWDSWEGNGVEAGRKGMNRRARHRCTPCRRPRRELPKGACSTLGEDEEGWKRCSSGSLGVLWVSFSVSRCPSSQSWPLLAQSLAPVTLLVRITFRILVWLCWQAQKEANAWNDRLSYSHLPLDGSQPCCGEGACGTQRKLWARSDRAT